MSTQQTTVQWLSDNWFWVILWIWILGGFGWAGEHWRKAIRARRQHQVNMALARRGIEPGHARPAATDGWDDVVEALPAAVIPKPPSAYPWQTVPGPCQHEKIVPVIGIDGELLRWICANPRCPAQFEKSIAIYEPRNEK